MKKITLSMILLILAALVLSACSPKTVEPTAGQQPSQPQGVIAEGRLLPANSLEHGFSVPGKVAEVLVRDGDRVTRGQPLARLAPTADAEAVLARAQMEELAAQQALDTLMETADRNLAQTRLTYLSAQDKFKDAEADYKSNETDENKARMDLAQADFLLAESALTTIENGKGIDPDQLAAAQARLTSAQAAVKSAQAYLDSLALTAEMDGTAAAITIQAGEQVGAGVPMLVVADFSNWIVKTDNLTEMEITGVKLDQKVEVVLDALTDVTLAGIVTAIDSRFEDKRGDITYTVTIQLDQVDPRMRWGMTAAVRFIE